MLELEVVSRQRRPTSWVARGLSPLMPRGAAAYRSRVIPTRIREETSEMNTSGLLETIWQDLRYGVRLLRAQPHFRDRRHPVRSPSATGRERGHLPAGRRGAAADASGQGRATAGRDPTSTRTGRGRYGPFHQPASAHDRTVLWRAVRERQQAFSEIPAWGTRNVRPGQQAVSLDPHRGSGSVASSFRRSACRRNIGRRADACRRSQRLPRHPASF